MPTYFYHLKFELYPTPTPDKEEPRDVPARHDIWLPPPETDVFGELPSHPRPHRQTSHKLRPIRRPLQQEIEGDSQVPTKSRTAPEVDPNVIDCGAPRAPSKKSGSLIERVSEREWLERSKSFPPPPSNAALKPRTAIQDWRFGRVSIETVMAGEVQRQASDGTVSAAPSLGPMLGDAGTTNKANYIPFKTKNTEVGWGVVHFYTEGQESPELEALDEEEELGEEAGSGAAGAAEKQSDYSTVCIPAVPAYMTPGDFLGFVGERWQEDITHCRMVMTSTINRYLALLKFRDSKRAVQWRKEYDGKVFNTMEPQICHAVFVKRITFETPTQSRHDRPVASSSSSVLNTLRPFPPPTPNLIELPTCPVCLERMDDTNGLMTIPCSHVFHCTCLQNWKGAGCPVCRFTSAAQHDGHDSTNPNKIPFGGEASNLCTVCDETEDLWICLICGYVGCGRYKGAHAKDHWKETAHSFALELLTQYVWDYAGDMWVHRLIRDKSDGKVVELPGRSNQREFHEDEDVVPRAKLENISLEYTHLLTSQLESQRAYYEELVQRAVSKASKATATAEAEAEESSVLKEKWATADDELKALKCEAIPQLEKDIKREQNKATKSQDLARNLANEVQENKRMIEGLMKRIEHLNVVQKENEQLKEEVAGLKDTNHDLTMFISGQEKLREMENEGKIEEGEIEGGTASVPEQKGRRRRKK